MDNLNRVSIDAGKDMKFACGWFWLNMFPGDPNKFIPRTA